MQVQKQLVQITKDLERMSKRIQIITSLLNQREEKKRRAPRAAVRNVRGAGTAAVLDAIRKSKKGIDALTLIKKTRLDGKKVRNILFRGLKDQKIERVSRGIYKINK